MSKLLIATVAVMITRDAMTILPATVPRHEVPVLHTVFGEDNVQEADDQSAAGATEIDSEGEVTRLENKYGPAALEKTHGTAYKSAIPKAMQEHVVQAPVADGNPKEDPNALDVVLDGMTKDELLAVAAKRGVKADASMTKTKIIEAIETANLV